MHMKVPTLPDNLAKKTGQSLRRCSGLRDIILVTGDDAVAKQLLEFKNNYLRFESVSMEFITLFLELNSKRMQKVRVIMTRNM